MSKHTTTMRFSGIGQTFRRLYVSDDSTRSLYITKYNDEYKLNYNYNGDITAYIGDSGKLKKVITAFKNKYMVDAMDTESRAIAIYTDVVKYSIINGTIAVDVISNKFRIKVHNYLKLSLHDIERALNNGKTSIVRGK